MTMANDSMDVDPVVVKLKSNDGKCFHFTEAEASCSSALRRMLESTRESRSYIPLQSIDGKVLSNIHQWCKMYCHHQSSVIPAAAEWHSKFLASFSELDLLKLMNGANFLDIESLYEACCRFMANRWEGMRVEAIRKRYNITNDLSAEDEMQLIQENKKLGITEW